MSETQFFQNVATGGNDTNDGLSWATPKATIDAALAALPVGGLVLLAPGSYSQKDTLVLNGHHLFGLCRSAGSRNAFVVIVCTFPDKPLISFAHGGQLTNVALSVYSSNTGCGDAISCVSPPFASVAGGHGTAFAPPVTPGGAVTFTGGGTVQTIIGCPPCTGFSPGGGHIAIDNAASPEQKEVLAYSGFTDGVFNVTTRAVGGTAAATHNVSPSAAANNGAAISQATVLTNPLSPTDVTATVGSTAGWQQSGPLQIEFETLFYTGTTPTTFTGLQRLSPDPHDAGKACVQPDGTRPGEIILDNVYIGGSFQRNFHLDGGHNNYPGGPGIRQILVSNGEWFGCRTTRETIVLNRVVHASFVGIDINPAGSPGGVVRQGIKIVDSISEQIFFANLYLAGDLASDAGGSQGDSIGTVVVEGYIAGTVTFNPGSAGNRVIGPVLAAVTDRGTGTPNITDKQPWKAVTAFQNNWRSDAAAIAEYFLDSSGIVHLRGSILGGAVTPGAPLFMLADGYYLPNPASPSLPRPQSFVAWARSSSNGNLAPCPITIIGKQVSLNPALAAPFSAESISLDGITFSILAP
jgi:hypothetical protein